MTGDPTNCRFITKKGMCTGRYSGYACIKKQCPSFQESQKCEFHEATGDYCSKYARFGCVGKESCGTISEYLEAVAEEEQA